MNQSNLKDKYSKYDFDDDEDLDNLDDKYSKYNFDDDEDLDNLDDKYSKYNFDDDEPEEISKKPSKRITKEDAKTRKARLVEGTYFDSNLTKK